MIMDSIDKVYPIIQDIITRQGFKASPYEVDGNFLVVRILNPVNAVIGSITLSDKELNLDEEALGLRINGLINDSAKGAVKESVNVRGKEEEFKKDLEVQLKEEISKNQNLTDLLNNIQNKLDEKEIRL